MKKLLLVACIIVCGRSSFGQIGPLTTGPVLPVYDTPPWAETDVLNLNSPDFIRIVDGLEVSQPSRISDGLDIHTTRLLSDSVKLAKMGLPYEGRPYVICTSEVTNLRQYIYDKARIGLNLRGMNIPIILNNTLITPDKYSLLGRVAKKDITDVKVLKQVPPGYTTRYTMPWGAIVVKTREDRSHTL
jgi:hypothetical protein